MKFKNHLSAIAQTVAFTALTASSFATQARESSTNWIDRGRHLVQTAGCNDCHTPGYIQNNGKVPEALWLTGSNQGWRGGWGTTYASNLRLAFQNMNETQWLVFARSAELRPPMPWFNLRAMTDDELVSIYRYVKSVGPAGKPAPAYLPPGQVPPQPFAQLPE
jgi:mono/diheme cytochrome c family protein